MSQTISLLIPTRERPEGFLRATLSALDLSHEGVRVLAYISEDDPRLNDYTIFNKYATIVVGKQQPTSVSWNLLAGIDPRADLIMLGSDDIVFETPEWDEKLRKAATPFDGLPHVFHFLDSRHPTNTPHPVMTKEWCKLMGWFVPPQFNHWYVDSFTCWVAKLAGVLTEVHDVKLTHDKRESSASRFPWSANWYEYDKVIWHSSTPDIERAMAKVLRSTGR